MESWIASGGEPNVARRPARTTDEAGFRVLEIGRVCARFRDAITPGNGPRASSKSTSPGYKSSAAFHRSGRRMCCANSAKQRPNQTLVHHADVPRNRGAEAMRVTASAAALALLSSAHARSILLRPAAFFDGQEVDISAVRQVRLVMIGGIIIRYPHRWLNAICRLAAGRG